MVSAIVVEDEGRSDKEDSDNVPIRFKDVVIIFCLACNNIILATNHTAPTFHNYAPEFKCKDYEDRDACNLKVYKNENQSSTDDKPVPDVCEVYEYDVQNGEISIVTEWNLVCNMEIYSALSVTLYFVSVAIGALIAGVLTDKYGRRSVLYACIYAQGVIGIFISFTARTCIQYIILRSTQGLFIQGILSSTYLLINEILPAKHRTIITGIIEIFWGLGLVLLAVIAYLLPNWRHLNFTTCLIPLVVASFSVWIVPESKTWLKIRAAAKETEDYQKRKKPKKDSTKYRDLVVCKTNGDKAVPSSDSVYRYSSYDCKSGTRRWLDCERDSSTCEKQSLTINNNDEEKRSDDDVIVDYRPSTDGRAQISDGRDIDAKSLDDRTNYSVWFQIKIAFSISVIRNRLLLMMLLWFTESVSYYGITFSIPKLFGNLYVNFIISGLIEIMFFVIICSIICRVGRKPTMTAAFFCSGFCYLLAAFLSNKKSGILRTFLVIIGKGCVMGNYMCLLLYTMELFPTNLRGMTLGVSLFCSQTGTFIAPIILLFQAQYTWLTLPFLIFATLNISSSLFVYCLLPETQNATLPETMEEAVELNKT